MVLTTSLLALVELKNGPEICRFERNAKLLLIVSELVSLSPSSNFITPTLDLIENSRQYETKHPNDGYLGQQKSSKSYQRGQANLAPPEAQLEPSSLTNPGTKYSIGSPEVCGQAYGPASAVCQRSTHGAFDNPYFRDEHPDELDRCDLERGSGALPTNFEHLYSKPAVRNFSSQQQSDQFGAQQPVDPGQHHQLDFIENRLANLHSRQLTSSVNELSVGQGKHHLS